MENKSLVKPEVSIGEQPIPIENRPIWRIGLICLAISILSGKNNAVSTNKVRLTVWMLSRPHLWKQYEDFFLNDGRHSTPLLAPDNSTQIALNISESKNLIAFSDNGISLTEEGLTLINSMTSIDMFKGESSFLKSIKPKLTNKALQTIMGGA